MLKHKKYIKKVHVTVETKSMEQALAIKQQSNTVFGVSFYELLEQIIEKVLQKYPSQNKYILSKIETELSVQKIESIADLKAEISAKIEREIEAKIQQKSSEEIVQEIIPNERNSYDAFFYFLENGFYPWWGNYDQKNSAKELLNLLDEPIFITKLKAKLNKSNTLYRFIYSTENKLLKNYLFNFLDASKLMVFAKTPFRSEQKTKQERLLFWAPLFYYALSKDTTIYTKKINEIIARNGSEIGEKRTKKIISQSMNFVSSIESLSSSKSEALQHQIFTPFQSNTISLEKQKKELRTQETHLEEEEQEFLTNETEFYVSNAGLILLHPFFESLFNKLGFLENGLLKNKYWDAVIHTLYYLATKQEQPHEHELLFIKYLCGIPAKTPVYKFYKLSDAIKTECKNVLEATLHYWPALKTNTTEILRSEFLMRDGKLTLTDTIEKLYIPRKTQDILLDSIPWTIGVAKFPWKKELIYTEW